MQTKNFWTILFTKTHVCTKNQSSFIPLPQKICSLVFLGTLLFSLSGYPETKYPLFTVCRDGSEFFFRSVSVITFIHD